MMLLVTKMREFMGNLVSLVSFMCHLDIRNSGNQTWVFFKKIVLIEKYLLKYHKTYRA